MNLENNVQEKALELHAVEMDARLGSRAHRNVNPAGVNSQPVEEVRIYSYYRVFEVLFFGSTQGMVLVVTSLPHCLQMYLSSSWAAGTNHKQPHD